MGCVAVALTCDQACSHMPHHADIRVNVIGMPDRSGEGPDAAIEIPGVSALCCHFGVHLSECGSWDKQAKCQQVKELFHRSAELDRCFNRKGGVHIPRMGERQS